mmetsp:Transcript_41949/g.97314  ORF Transcript_41949/g.97314 Transcript_41949/m.97314 type:complete len:228 (+) Transcript_41949:553-1236(+)
MPGTAAYTERGTRTTANLRKSARSPPAPSGLAAVRESGAISSGKRFANSPSAASTISSSEHFSQSRSAPASIVQGAKTISITPRPSASSYSRQLFDMSAYTESSGEREKANPSREEGRGRSNQSCTFITGIPFNGSIPSKNSAEAEAGSSHLVGSRRLNTSTGMALTYMSASTLSPPSSNSAATEPSSFSSIERTGTPVRTSPPSARTCSTMGLQSRSGWLPSMKAV